MAIQIFRHIHTGNQTTLREKAYQPNWIRRITTEIDAKIVREEIDAFDNSYVDMFTSIIVERPGTPPLAGVACETMFPEDEDETTSLTLYYYSWPELTGNTLPLEAARPANTYHSDGAVVDFPDWIVPDAADVYEPLPEPEEPADEDAQDEQQEKLDEDAGEGVA